MEAIESLPPYGGTISISTGSFFIPETGKGIIQLIISAVCKKMNGKNNNTVANNMLPAKNLWGSIRMQINNTVMDEMEGELEITSVQGKGSNFEILLPYSG